MDFLRWFLTLAVGCALLGCDDGGEFDPTGHKSESKPKDSLAASISPREVYRLSADLARKGDLDALYELYDRETHRLYDQIGERAGVSGRELFSRQMGPMMQNMNGNNGNANADLREEINGDRATLKLAVNSRFAGFNTDIELIRENGVWKLRLPKLFRDSMLQMEAMRKQVEQNHPVPVDVHDIPVNGLIPRDNWKIVYVSSEDADFGHSAAHAIDGNPKTFWKSQSGSRSKQARHPHAIVIDLGKEYTVRGFRYLTRQDGRWDGTIRQCQYYVSNEPKKFEKPVATSRFRRTRASQEVTFAPAKGRYVGIRTISEYYNRPEAAIAELGVIGE